jgi:hypothetical protein
MKIDRLATPDVKKVFVFMVMGSICIFCLVAIFITPGFGDEINYHSPLARNISWRQVMDLHSDYSSAYTPLPYLIGSAALKIWDSLYALRILNYLVFLAMICAFHLLASNFLKDGWLLTFLVFLNPYLMMSAFVYYMYNWGLLFAFLGLYFYLVRNSNLLANLFVSLAVLSQQWMLVLVIAIWLHGWVLFRERKITLRVFMKGTLWQFFFLAPAILLFIRWQGLTHPNFSSHAMSPSFEHLSAVLSHFGFIMLFPILATARGFFRAKYIPLLFSAPLFWLSIPRHASLSDLTHISGYLSHGAMKIEHFLHVPYRWVIFILILPGLLLILSVANKIENEKIRVFGYAILGLTAALVASVRLTTAHVYLVVPFIILFLHEEIGKMKGLKWLMSMQYLLVCGFYIIYLVFFRSRGILL